MEETTSRTSIQGLERPAGPTQVLERLDQVCSVGRKQDHVARSLAPWCCGVNSLIFDIYVDSRGSDLGDKVVVFE